MRTRGHPRESHWVQGADVVKHALQELRCPGGGHQTYRGPDQGQSHSLTQNQLTTEARSAPTATLMPNSRVR